MKDERARSWNELSLQWHAASATVPLEAFQTWCLATLGQQLPHAGAIWGQLSEPGARPPRPRLQGAHLVRLNEAVLACVEKMFADRAFALAAKGRVVNFSTTQAAERDAWSSEAAAHGLAFALATCAPPARGYARQFIVLSRQSHGMAFDAREAARFELLAPHMMLAYENCRKFVLSSPGSRHAAGHAAALVDKFGVIVEQHARFVPMMQREWSDWAGGRLPESLLELAVRRAGTPWRFVGTDISAEFMPVDDLYLVTARPSHVGQSLSSRELEVARKFATGASFREIATALSLAPTTVRSHLRNVYSKLQIRNKAQLTALLR